MEPTTSSNYRPGEPLRAWDSGDEAAMDALLVLDRSRAAAAVLALDQGRDLTVDDIAALGVANSAAHHTWYEPIATLLRPRLDPGFAQLLAVRLRPQVEKLERQQSAA